MTQISLGGCLCGVVTYEVAGAFEAFFLCHCSRCRKGTGSAHAANLISTSAKLKWCAGEGSVTSYKVAGTRHERSFCTECGSAVPGVHMNGALLIVPAGSLDTEIAMRPTAHICMSSRAAWDEGLENIPKLDGMPG
ncbi:MAG: GFA family protein [Rhodospirillaceae bacterium]|nr:GFA family protein [Rhodospirillaceae bacterium]